MIRYSSEVTIARPPHAVHEALLDPGHYPKWTDMVDVSLDGADPGSGEAAEAIRLKARLESDPTGSR